MKDSHMNNRDKTIEETKAKLETLKAEVDRFEADKERLSANVEIKRLEALKVVRQKLEDVESRLRNLQDANETAWTELSEDLEATLKDFTRTFEEVRDHFFD